MEEEYAADYASRDSEGAEGGRDTPPEEIFFLPKPLRLNHVSELVNLMETDDNAVVLFFMQGCPACVQFNAVFEPLAKSIHATNLESDPEGVPNVPIVFASIDGAAHRDEINRLWPGFFGPERGYPTVMFKRSDGAVKIWNPEKPRTKANLLTFMSAFFDDPTLMPYKDSLAKIMNNPDPEFVYFYSDNVTVVPRFVRPLDPGFTDLHDSIETLNHVFLRNPGLASRGSAYPVNRMDRTDIRIPAVFDRTEDREYALHDSHRWAISRLRDSAP